MKKRLLNEEVTRRFMKLANIDTLSESFIEETESLDEMGMAYARDEEEPADAPMDDMAAEEEPMDVPEEGGEVDVMSLVDAIASAIESETGVSVDVEGAGAEGGDEMPEEPMEEPMEEPEMGAEEPAEPEEEVMQEDDIDEDLAAANVTLDEENLDEDDLVNEVTRRVARRLLRASAGNR